MDSDLINHINKCRCCFKSIKSQRKGNKITEKIEKQFYEVVQIELKPSELCSSTICDACKKELEIAAEIKEKFGRNQTRLLKFVQEQKSPEQSNDDDDNGRIREDTKESTVDQFDLNNFKWDEVVVKVEPVGFNDFCVKDAGLFEFFELPKPVANDNPPWKIEILPSEICAEVPTAYKRCYVCGESVAASSLVKHIKSHRGNDNKLHCRFCSYKHTTSSSFINHMETHSTTPPAFNCRECGKVFVDITGKEKHERKHQNESCISNSGSNCDKCDQKFKTVSKLFKHNRDDHKIENLPCKICGKLLKMNSYIKHMAAHNEKSRKVFFSCDQCDYKTFFRRNIIHHMKKHTIKFIRKIALNEKYPCDQCSKVFSSCAYRTVHVKSKHLNIAHICDCGKVYNSYAGLYMHKKNQHSDLKLKCQKCVEVFPSKQQLKEHFDRYHAAKSPCEICGKMVGPGRAFMSHKMSAHAKKVQCEYEGCGKILYNIKSYQGHVKVFHEPQGSYKCTTCDAEFSNEYRLQIHISRQHKTEKKPCQVPGCSHSTFRTSYLIMHYKNHKNISVEEKEELIRKLKSKRN